MRLEKYENNPILTKNPQNDWESLCVLNPAVIQGNDGRYFMLYRAAGNDEEHIIRLGLAVSNDGIHFERVSPKPLLSPDPMGPDAGGVEDPRLIKMGDYYYLTYASRPFPPGQYWKEDKGYYGFQPVFGPRILIHNATATHLAISKDLRNWKKLGRISNALFDDRDDIIFPEKVHDQYVRISRAMEKCGDGYPNPNPAIWISFSSDLLEWKGEESLLYQGEAWWEDEKVGGSCPPIKTKDGWLFLYHGVAKKDHAYRVGALLLDLDDPCIIKAKSKDFLLEPEYPFETEGFYNGCVFPTAIIEKGDEYYVYYGAGDQCVCLAKAKKEALLDALKEGRL